MKHMRHNTEEGIKKGIKKIVKKAALNAGEEAITGTFCIAWLYEPTIPKELIFEKRKKGTNLSN